MPPAKNNFGDILFHLRTRRGLSQEKVCSGLCSIATYSRYELGERVPDRLTLDALFQRMGNSADKLSTVLSWEEYNYFQWRKQVLVAAQNEDFDELKRLLLDAPLCESSTSEGLRRQFLCRMQAIATTNIEESIELLRQAIDLTLPGFQVGQMESYLISVEEMHLLISLANLLTKAGKREYSSELLSEAVRYIDSHYDDAELKIMVLPLAVKSLSPLLIAKGEYIECMALCKNAIELLCKIGALFDLVELMESYLNCSKVGPQTELTLRYEKQVQALKDLYEEYGADLYQTESSFLYYRNQEIYLMDEVIRSARLDMDLSQESLSEGICAPETLSRIESGKRAPSTKNFYALMDKLHQETNYFNPGVDTSNFLLLEKQREIRRAEALNDWAKAESLLEELRAGLEEEGSLDRPKNQLYLVSAESCARFNQNKLSAEEFIENCLKLLGCKGEEWREDAFWTQLLPWDKMSILNYLANLYYDHRHEPEKSALIWRNILKQLSSSKVAISNRYSPNMTALQNLSTYYGEFNLWEECLQINEEGITFCLESGRGVRLGHFIINKAESLIALGQEKYACSNYVKQAYYLSDLFRVRSTNAYVDRYYQANIDAQIKWY